MDQVLWGRYFQKYALQRPDDSHSSLSVSPCFMAISDDLSSHDDHVDPEGSTSSRLLERARVFDAGAWQQLSDLYGPLIYRWARRQGLPAEDSADVVQEVFRSLAAHIESFRKERSGDSFRGWLWTITRNKIHDHFRRLGRDPRGIGGTDAHRQFLSAAAPDVPSIGESNAAGPINIPLHLAMEAIQGEFGERTWRAFRLAMSTRQTSREIAEDLGMTPNAVRLAKARVLRRLRRELGEEPG